MKLTKANLLLTIAVIATGVYIVKKDLHLPRNVRNKNPLNIKESADWNGERAVNQDAVFEEFTTAEYGFRAGYIILLQYKERGLNNIIDIINEWAPPPSEAPEDHNHTEEYIDYLADKMEMSPVEKVYATDLPEMMLHMSNFEGAKGHFTIEQAQGGVVLAHQEDFVTARLDRLGEYVHA